MMNPAKTLKSSVLLNGAVSAVGSVGEKLNLLQKGSLSVDILREGFEAAQGKAAGCELLVVFDARVSDLPTLLGSVVEGAGCYVLSEDEDAIAVVTRLLADTGARRLAIVAHGEPGVVHLGACPLNEAQIQAQSRLLQEWGVEEIALYSCEVAKSAVGERMIHALALLTGAAVAASVNQVGSIALGGSWDLEITTAIFSRSKFFDFDLLQTYEAILTVVGYYDMSLGQGNPSQVAAITASGRTARQLFDLTPADLDGIDVLLVQNQSNDGYGGEYLNRLTAINNAVFNGMTLIIHDRYVDNAESILPGVSGNFIFRSFFDNANIQIGNTNPEITNGPGGVLTNSSLDNGSSSSHGYALASGLPPNANIILTRTNSNEAVTFSYSYGTGTVIYSSIPLDFYLPLSGTLADAMRVYAQNVIAFANDAPSLTSIPQSFTITEDVSGNLVYTNTPFADIDSTLLTVTLSVSDGIITGNAGTGITVGGTATVRTFVGTAADLNAYFTTAGKITYTTAPNNTTGRTLTTSISDGSLSRTFSSIINITPVNDAPYLNNAASPVLTSIVEDGLSSGNTIAQIVVDGSITDVDITGAAPEAIAVSAVDNTNGTWQYQLSGGSWTAFDFTGPNTGKALLLDSTAQIRFVPNANYSGTATFTFRAWDQNLGTSGSYFTFTTVAGTLDSTFGTGGIAFADFNNGLDIANTIAVQADGKTIVAGYTHPSNGYRDSAFARFNSDGTLDTTFGSAGKVVIDLGSTGNDQIEKIHTLSGGGLLAAGIAYQSSGLFNFSLTKLTASGSLDTSFGSGGKVVTNLGNNSYIYDSVILANGKIVAVGTLQNAGFALVQYNSDGTLDTSFDTDGIATTTLGSASDTARSVTTTPDGKILVAGFYYGPSGQTLGLTRFNSNGTLDTTFDADGKLTVGDRIFVDDELSTVRVVGLADGRFLVGATTAYPDGFRATVYRFNSDGTLDSSFGSSGKQQVNISTYTNIYLNDLQVSADGKIVLATSPYKGTDFDFAGVRLNADGSLDTSFGTNGVTLIPVSTLSSNPSDFARAIQIDPAGNILIGGYSYQTSGFNGDRQFALVRLKGDTFESTVSTQSDTASITVTPVNDPPILDLNGAATGIDFSTTFTEDGGAVSIVSPNLSLTDIDSPTISSATITITNLQDSATESLSLPSTFGYMAATYSTSTGTFQLLGTATLAQYQQVLRTITYNNTSQNPNFTPRQISFVVNDGTSNSAIATSTISINPVNDPPFLDLNGAAPGTNFSTTFTEDGGAISIVSPTLTLTDADSTQVNIATARITNLQNVGSELLSANTAGTSIVATYYASVGILELRGFDTVANYQQVLRSITYNNISQNPTLGDRTIEFGVNDSMANSNIPIATVSVIPVNDAPIVANAITTQNGIEDTAINFTIPANTFSDADNASLTLTATLGNGSALPAWLLFTPATGSFSGTPPQDFNGTISLKVTATDSGSLSASSTFDLVIAAANDVPVAIASSNAVLEDATITGSVTATDADTGAILTYALVNPAPTGLTFNSSGTYTFDASSYDSLAAGQTQVLNIAFTATDGIATSTPENLTITLTGTNDAAIITGTSTGSVLESGTNSSGTPTATGDLNATDIDNTSDAWTAVATATTTANGYGTYTLSTNGVWNYTLNNTNSTIQALNTGDTLTDTFTVGTIDGTTQTVSITINGTNDTPIITSVSDDTGASNTDRITKDNTLTLTGNAEANSTIALFNGLTALGTTTTTNLGTWNLTTATLTDGTYNLTAKAIDAAGNTSASSAPVTVTVDTTAAAPTLSLAIDSGSSATDKITNSGIVNVGGLEPGASWEYSTNNGSTWTTGTGSNFTLTVDGIKTAIVRQTDLAGNTSNSSAPFTFTLDTIAPNKTATVNTMTLDSGTSPTDFLTNNGSAGRIYNGTLSTTLAAGESLQISVDGGTTWANATVSSTTWNFTDNTPKSSNWNILTRVVDTAGNGTIRSRTVTLDQQISAASTVTLDLLASSDSGSSSTDNLTNLARPTFTVTFDSANAQVGDILEIRQGTILLGSFTLTTAQVSTGTANLTLTTNLTSGINTLTAVHRDAAGNSVTGSSSLAVTIDQQISAASAVTLDLLASSDSGSSSTDNLTNLALSTFAVTFDSTKAQAGDIVEVRKGTAVLGSTTLTTAQVSAGIANVTLTTAITSGLNTLSAVHRDPAGNSVIGSSTLAVTLDTTAPIAATVNGYTATSIFGTTEPNGTVLLSTSASAPTTFAATATAAANGNYTLNTSTLTGSSAVTTYYLYAQDVAGNLSALNSSQKVIVGTTGTDTLINVGSTAGDLLVGGFGTDTAQYAVASNAISLTGQITTANISSGSINIRNANIDVLTGLETLQFAGVGYSGVGTGTNQLRSGVQTALANNSIAALTGVYDPTTGIFTLGSSPSNNATLVAFDSNAGTVTNYESFLLLDKTSIAGGLSIASGTVTLGL